MARYRAEALKGRILAELKSKPWFQDNENCVHVEYDRQKDVYDITMWWIEDWKPGNHGYRMRSDFQLYPGESVPLAVDIARWDALCWHYETGLYPNNLRRRQGWLSRKIATE